MVAGCCAPPTQSRLRASPVRHAAEPPRITRNAPSFFAAFHNHVANQAECGSGVAPARHNGPPTQMGTISSKDENNEVFDPADKADGFKLSREFKTPTAAARADALPTADPSQCVAAAEPAFHSALRAHRASCGSAAGVSLSEVTIEPKEKPRNPADAAIGAMVPWGNDAPRS